MWGLGFDVTRRFFFGVSADVRRDYEIRVPLSSSRRLMLHHKYAYEGVGLIALIIEWEYGVFLDQQVNSWLYVTVAVTVAQP